jgi:hypothetical protein
VNVRARSCSSRSAFESRMSIGVRLRSEECRRVREDRS